MIRTGVYYNNNNIYKEDLIINLKKPDIYMKLKNITFVIHNSNNLIKYKDIVNQLIIFKNLINYQVIYTSNITKINNEFDEMIDFNSNYDILNNLDDLINRCYYDNRFNIIILISYDLKLLNKNLINKNLININIANIANIANINDIEEIQKYIEKIIFEQEIIIIDSNIKNLINRVYTFDKNSYDISIFVENKFNNIKFINYLKYKIYGFDNIEYQINLYYKEDNNLKDQIISIQDKIIEYLNLNSKIEEKDFKLIKQKYVDTLNYYTFFINEDEKKFFSELIFDFNIQFNILQNKKIKNDLELTNQKDSLVFNSFLTTKTNIKNKLSKIYLKNRSKKIINNLDYDLDILLLDKKILNSFDFYTSPISLSNWYDEIKNNSCLGILINVSCQYSDKMGYTSDTINVINITSTLLSPDQIYDGHQYFWNRFNKLDKGIYIDSIISGSTIGKGNSLLPIYINKYHWYFAKQHIEENISIAITQNPYLFKPIMMDLYTHVLLKFINYILVSDYSDKNIRLLFIIIITMEKLDFNKIKSFYDDFSDIHNLRPVLTSFLINFLFGKIKPSKRECDLYFLKLHEEMTRRNMKKNNKTKEKFLKILQNNNCVINFFENEIDQENIIELENVWLFIQLFNSEFFIKLKDKYEESYGFIEDSYIIEFKNKIKNNNIFFNFKELCKFGDSYNDIIKYYILQTFLTRTPKLKEKFKITNTIINVFDNNNDILKISIQNYENLLKILNAS